MANSEKTSQPLEFPLWFDKSKATHQVARGIMQYGPIARTPLAQIYDLSQGALSRITSDLIYDGVVEETPDADLSSGKLPEGFELKKDSADRRGRPQTALQIRADQHTFVGVNMHDRSFTVTQVDTMCRSVGTTITEEFENLAPRKTAEQIARVIYECVNPKVPAPTAIGISLGGSVDADRVVTFAPYMHWNDPVDFAQLLEEYTGIPTKVFNDLNSTLVYESWFGEAVGWQRFAVLTIGAGVGYSISDNGDPVSNPDINYGLAGHILVDVDGPRCFSGHMGCSQCLTTDSITEEYSQKVGRTVSFEEFSKDLEQNKPQARRFAEKTCFRLGVLIATVANIALPSHVLISGETSFIAESAVESIRKGIETYRHSRTSSVDFEILPFDWELWAKSAAAQAIAAFMGF